MVWCFGYTTNSYLLQRLWMSMIKEFLLKSSSREHKVSSINSSNIGFFWVDCGHWNSIFIMNRLMMIYSQYEQFVFSNIIKISSSKFSHQLNGWFFLLHSLLVKSFLTEVLYQQPNFQYIIRWRIKKLKFIIRTFWRFNVELFHVYISTNSIQQYTITYTSRILQCHFIIFF